MINFKAFNILVPKENMKLICFPITLSRLAYAYAFTSCNRTAPVNRLYRLLL